MPKTEIVTQRLKLRLIDLSDLESIHELHSLPESDKYNALGIPETIDETKSVIQPWILEHQSIEIKNYTFAIDNNLNGTFMGLFGVKLGDKKYKRAEVWYKIHSDYWNKGYATEATTFWLDHGFNTIKIKTMNAYTHAENGASNHILEKAGFQEMETYYNYP